MTKDTDASRQKISAEQRLSIEYVRECFELRGSEVYWRDRPVRHFANESAWKVFQGKYAGKPAGRKEINGYITINMRYRGARVQFQAHRVVWMLHHGKWPEQMIDHINRVRSDNRIENLRDADNSVNQRNRIYRASSGHQGSMKSGTKFMSHVRVGSEYVYLGIFDTEEEAQAHHRHAAAALVEAAQSFRKYGSPGRPRKQA